MISLSNKSHHWRSSQMRMPFDSNHSVPHSPHPSGWLGRSFQKPGKASPALLLDIVMPVWQNAKMRLPASFAPDIPSWYRTEWKWAVPPDAALSLVPWLVIHVGINCQSLGDCHPCRHQLSVSRGHLAPYCLWTQNKKGIAAWLWAQTPHQVAKSQAHFLPGVGFLVTFYAFVSASVKWRQWLYIPGELADGNL